MGPNSRSRSQPRGGRAPSGAPRGRGRGRGTGRGGSRGLKRPRFDSTRVAAQDEEQPEEEDSEVVPTSESEEEPESDHEAVPESSGNSYFSLMKSFAEMSAPQVKKRKGHHDESQDEVVRDQKPVAPEADEEKDPDLVEEPEDDPQDDIHDDLSDDDGQTDAADSFESHFAADFDEVAIATKIKRVKDNDWSTKKAVSRSSRMVFTVPSAVDANISMISSLAVGPSNLKLKKRLQEAITAQRPTFDDVEQTVAPLLFQYYDTLFCGRDVSNGESLRRMACLHALNHVFKTRDRVIKNNAKLTREADNHELELRDQGYTRPKVLMLLPTRNSCAKMADMICSLCRPETQENRKRFEDSYIDKSQSFSDDKPADFRDLFGGSDDDMFRLGMKFTRKTVKYFSQFYNSDIIFASPLGLRMAIGSEEDKKKVDFDFLSSIEVVIVDQADALLMQNWEHVEFIFEHLNLQPKDAHGCDFSRVRSWYLDMNAKYFRQTIIFSAFNAPELSELVRSHCHNWAGRVRVQPEYPGVIGQLGIKAKQTFSRYHSPSVEIDPDTRFAYFTKAVVPLLAKRAKDSVGTLIFIPSYLDFVRVRNYFATNTAVANLTFGTISEYADVPEASRARSHFLNGRHHVLLYTERAHHFRRYQLKGVQRVILYGLPDNPLFYKEITGGYLGGSEQDLKLEPGQGSVKVMFSQYDALKLERIVGSHRVGKMIKERSDTFVFEEEKSR